MRLQSCIRWLVVFVFVVTISAFVLSAMAYALAVIRFGNRIEFGWLSDNALPIHACLCCCFPLATHVIVRGMTLPLVANEIVLRTALVIVLLASIFCPEIVVLCGPQYIVCCLALICRPCRDDYGVTVGLLSLVAYASDHWLIRSPADEIGPLQMGMSILVIALALVLFLKGIVLVRKEFDVDWGQ